MQVVWFKRDLRVKDHRPLAAAAATRQPVLCLYIVEPELWDLPDADARHLHFITQCLAELQDSLEKLEGLLTIRIGHARDVLDQIHTATPVTHLHSHEETGNLWTYERDRDIGRWCREHNVKWTEHVQTGVIRRLKIRDGWAAKWRRRMNEPLTPSPRSLQIADTIVSDNMPSPESLGLQCEVERTQLQPGGESKAHEMLRSFLRTRGTNYHREMSSPVTAWDSCSRLSAHLAWGTISMRQIYQALERQIRICQQRTSRGVEGATQHLNAMKAFQERLHWHCHFIQKLEDQPDIEVVNMQRACDNLRPEDPDPVLFEAWKSGNTGYPLVDACMRSVQVTGWLNFRMRAMVVSFASYHLWLDWRPTSRWLARMFTDYEPGIHYSQFQMQSGTTGISSVRIYNPIKQVHDHDPSGVFIRHWVPELRQVPDRFLAEPATMSVAEQKQSGCRIGIDYPPPIVNHQQAYAEAQRRMKTVRRNDVAKREARDVFFRHGSRRGPRHR